MILPDEDSKRPQRPSNASEGPFEGASGESPTPVPTPALHDELEFERHEPLPPYTPRDTDPLLPVASPTRKRKRFGSVRLACKCLPLLLASLATCVLTLASMRASARYDRERLGERICISADRWIWSDRTEDDPRFHIQAGTSLPADLSSFHFSSVSSGVLGTLQIQAPTDYRIQGIVVAIAASHTDPMVLKRVSICKTIFRNGTAKASLEVSRLPSGATPIFLDMAIQLPGPPYPEHAPRHIDNMTIEVSSADVNVSVPQSTAHFRTFTLSATNGSITVDRMQADHISLSANGRPLTANVHSGSFVALTNTDAPILANISVLSEDRHANRSVVRISSHGAINTSVSLFNSAARHRPALDLAAASISSDSSEVWIATAPPDSLISAHVTSSGGHASLSLPPSFEGNFLLCASHIGSRHLRLHRDEVDPSGRGRNRAEWHRREDGGAISGWTRWGEQNRVGQIGFANVSGASASLDI